MGCNRNTLKVVLLIAFALLSCNVFTAELSIEGKATLTNHLRTLMIVTMDYGIESIECVQMANTMYDAISADIGTPLTPKQIELLNVNYAELAKELVCPTNLKVKEDTLNWWFEIINTTIK